VLTLKKILLISLVIIALTAVAFINNMVSATTNPIVWYKFDETSGTSAADSSGNGKTATLVNGPTWVAGKLSNAVNMDGTNDYVSMPSGIVSTLNDFSIATWVKLDTISTWSRIFDLGTGTTVNMFLTPRSGSSAIRFAITTNGGSSEQQINGTAALPTGAWKHVAVTLSGSLGILYVDGVEVGRNGSMTLKPSSLGSTNLNYIGKSQYADPYLDGQVDDFRIYDRALSSSEVLALYGGPTPTPTPTVAPTPSPTTCAVMTVNAATPGINISQALYGIFFEEINHAGDGGLYAELIKNRSLEDNTSSPEAWSAVVSSGSAGTIALDTTTPLNSAQTRSLKINATDIGSSGRVGAANTGYWGINVINGTAYTLSFFARSSSGYIGSLTARLENADGSIVYASNTVSGLTTSWQRFNTTLTASGSAPTARFVISTATTGTIWLDVVSLFPPTWKGRSNGLRSDLANMVNDMKPRFNRFPGGCYVEGDYLANRFIWKNTIGNISTRPGHLNANWGYRSTDGLGFHEYLQMTEDIGAEALFVINCGISHNDNIPVANINTYVQDALDAIQYAVGDTSTTWGAQRAANGHPAPFNLKYIEIGNENNFQQADYELRYPYFYNAIKQNYPSMICIADSNVPGSTIEYIDEHYYQNPQWFIDNASKYDGYSRTGPKIYVGEYACTSGCGNGNLAAAVGEAAFMTGMERNSDVVKMSSYAPLFVNVNNRAWNPDTICFDSSNVYGTPSYHVQKMFANNLGDVLLPTSATNNQNPGTQAINGNIGLGTWATQAQFDDTVVTSGSTTLFTDNFTSGSAQWTPQVGTWSATGGVYQQTATSDNCTSIAANITATTYTYTCKAMKTGGNEGFLIMFGRKDSSNYYWWNLGGWGNTKHAIEKCVAGTKSTIGASVNGSINLNQWYNIKIEVSGNNIKCYLDNVLIHNVNDGGSALYFACSKQNSTGDIIMKVVNVTAQSRNTQVTVSGASYINPNGTATVLTSGNTADENSLSSPAKVIPVVQNLTNLGTTFNFNFPPNSVTILRLKTL
jgi:alpha-L-arabinofuranosidase